MSVLDVECENDLEREVWRFFYDERDHVLHFKSYAKETRPTTRHKFRVKEFWGPTYYNGRDDKYMKHRPVALAEVQAMALRQFRETLTIDVIG